MGNFNRFGDKILFYTVGTGLAAQVFKWVTIEFDCFIISITKYGSRVSRTSRYSYNQIKLKKKIKK